MFPAFSYNKKLRRTGFQDDTSTRALGPTRRDQIYYPRSAGSSFTGQFGRSPQCGPKGERSLCNTDHTFSVLAEYENSLGVPGLSSGWKTVPLQRGCGLCSWILPNSRVTASGNAGESPGPIQRARERFRTIPLPVCPKCDVKEKAGKPIPPDIG